VLVSGVPGLGHLVPVLDLAGALQLAGHEVRVATNQEFHAVIAGAGLQTVSAGMSNVEMREQRSRRWPETDAQPVRVWATRDVGAGDGAEHAR
jgi:UDP:flavonoid glycosyltransferase YjiC (YdhE family)